MTAENVALEKRIVDLLTANHMTITCAESCTGGMLSGRIINVPGVSDAYKSGVVTYSNEAKKKFLNVKEGTLNQYGAVSEQTAREMAQGALELAEADVALAVTGIAGPDGGTAEKPVGLVYIACNVKGNITIKECHFSGSRLEIREDTTTQALLLAYDCMMEYLN